MKNKKTCLRCKRNLLNIGVVPGTDICGDCAPHVKVARCKRCKKGRFVNKETGCCLDEIQCGLDEWERVTPEHEKKLAKKAAKDAVKIFNKIT